MSTLKDLEKLKTILFTDDQIASENFSLPVKPLLTSKESIKVLTTISCLYLFLPSFTALLQN